MIIKCISLWNPWAWAMWNCLKEWETRSATAPVVAQLRKYSGEWIGIQSAQKPAIEAIELGLFGCSPLKTSDQQIKYEAWYNRLLVHAGDRLCGPWQYGMLGGICRIGKIHQTHEIAPKLSEQELFFGDYSPGRRAIHCPGMIKLETPIPMRGSQSAWDWEVPPHIEKLLRVKP